MTDDKLYPHRGSPGPPEDEGQREERDAGKRHSSEGTTLWAPGWGCLHCTGKRKEGKMPAVSGAGG